MSYASIDSIILPWANKHGLNLSSRYRDSDVRSIQIVDRGGKRYQIWIDEPQGESVTVHAWDYRRKRSDWHTTRNELEKCLDQARETVSEWCQ
jgi:hypothetical protein